MPNARITFDKFHTIGHASATVDKMHRIEQEVDNSLKGMHWTLLKDRANLKPVAAADLDALIDKMAVKRTARAWSYKGQLRGILQRKQITDECGARPVGALMHLRDEIQGRPDEGGRQGDSHST